MSDTTVPNTTQTGQSEHPSMRRKGGRLSVPLRPAGVRRAGAVRVVPFSPATFDRLVAAGHAPPGAKVGNSRVWSVRQLRLWVDHGCPPWSQFRPIWEHHLSTARRGR